MRKRFNSNKFKKMAKIVGIVLVSVMLAAVLGNITGGFANVWNPSEWTFREVNEDNVYQAFTFADKEGVINDGENGITVELNKYNALKVKGTAEGEQAITIASGTLKAGTSYVFDSSLAEASNETIYMTVENTDGEVIATSYKSAVIIDALTADTTVYVKLHVADKYEIKHTLTLEPVICVGEKKGDLVKFFA